MEKDFSTCSINETKKATIGMCVISILAMCAGLRDYSDKSFEIMKAVYTSPDVTSDKHNRIEINSFVEQKIQNENLELDIDYQKVRENVVKINLYISSILKRNVALEDVFYTDTEKYGNEQINKKMLSHLSDKIYPKVISYIFDALLNKKRNLEVIFSQKTCDLIYDYVSSEKRKELLKKEITNWCYYNSLQTFCDIDFVEVEEKIKLVIAFRRNLQM